MRLQERLTQRLTQPPAVLVVLGLVVVLLGVFAPFLGGPPDPGLAMMGAGVAVVVAGAMSLRSNIGVGITTLIGGVVMGAGAFALILRVSGFGYVGFLLSVALVAVGVAMLGVGLAVVVGGAVNAGTAGLKRCLLPGESNS